MADKDDIKNFLASHPRLLGGIFMVMLLLGQAGTVAGGCQCTRVGP
ncbi:DUF7503 family protein [Natronoglomus mannanivorans]|nr:hypothetical protein [Halobacteria archaeon AArc-xg1-1]